MKMKPTARLVQCLGLNVAFLVWLLPSSRGATNELGAPKRPSPEAIVKGATDTYLASGVSKEIPKEKWAPAIRDLKPLKVYTDYVNVVVVQKKTAETEEGLYIYIPLSSYMPIDGVHGFHLNPKPNRGNSYFIGDGIFSYQKRTTKPAGGNAE